MSKMDFEAVAKVPTLSLQANDFRVKTETNVLGYR